MDYQRFNKVKIPPEVMAEYRRSVDALFDDDAFERAMYGPKEGTSHAPRIFRPKLHERNITQYCKVEVS